MTKLGFDTYIPQVRNDMLNFLKNSKIDLKLDKIIQKNPTIFVHWEEVEPRLNVHIEYNIDGSANNIDICPYTQVSSMDGLILPDSISHVIEMFSGSILDGFDEYIKNYAKDKNISVTRLYNEAWQISYSA